MAISKQAHNFKANASELLGEIKNAAGTTFSRDGWKAAEGAKVVKDGGGFLGVVFKPFKWAADIGIAIIKLPVDLGMRAGNAVLGNTTKFIKGNPKTAIIGGTAVAVLGGAHMLAKHNAKKLEAQSDAVQQLQAIQAAQPVSYMNSASYADVQAKMDADRAAGAAPAGQAASVAASRAADAQQASPAV